MNEMNETHERRKWMKSKQGKERTNEWMSLMSDCMNARKSERTNEWMLFWGQVHSQRTFGTHKVYTCDSHDN